ncbi:PhoH-like protein [Halomicronema hongdechloris C2206]|uniref:PhoH-like protein n=1 Tax=Halomicronema hongdechloris C2206 TaxID=1641165 RepID=A0A1Z3HJZ4_9CYAN|nr:PhoH family protein [Halomicronema hongdechloris]ASC70642.1 PhoH-like protein [Halomicronema hongdechloris C2206]
MPHTVQVDLTSDESAIALSGYHGENLKLLAHQTGTTIAMRGRSLVISGTEATADLCRRIVLSLEPLWSQGQTLTSADIMTARQALDTDRLDELQSIQHDIIARTRRGEVIRAKTFRQRQYIKALKRYDLTFCTGPAGTGKTFLAAMVGVKALMNDEYERLILTRPAVEAGERLGFLPGDLQQKINPYLRPLYDALHELIDPEKIPSLMERGVIEVAPLAYMRGRTLNNAFIIMDEAQNTSPAQMKMVLTRLGFQARMVVTGDTTQTDLNPGQTSGLILAQKILQNVDGIAFCKFTQSDVVRHPLVQRIVAAYEKAE